MIEEAYVSFEVAKLLKEKGFEGLCSTAYETITSKHNIEEVAISNWGKLNQIKRPTQQMAMAWLREEYKIAINIRITCKETISYAFDIWDFEIIHPNEFVGGTIDLIEQQFDFKSYEEAVEAALKYVLENLI